MSTTRWSSVSFASSGCPARCVDLKFDTTRWGWKGHFDPAESVPRDSQIHRWTVLFVRRHDKSCRDQTQAHGEARPTPTRQEAGMAYRVLKEVVGERGEHAGYEQSPMLSQTDRLATLGFAPRSARSASATGRAETKWPREIGRSG